MRIFFLSFLLIFFTACSRDDVSEVPANRPDEAVYTLPVELALKNLEAALTGCDVRSRATTGREIVRVERLQACDLFPATRSGKKLDGVKDLLYFVSFGEGAGSAILGADVRIQPIYAILDETILTPEDFLSTYTASYSGKEELQHYIVASLKQAVLNDFDPEVPPLCLQGPQGDRTRKFEPAPSTVIIKSNQKIRAPVCKTKWGQWAPYNNDCPSDKGVRCPAGCVAIAVGQIMAAHHTPSTFGGKPVDWTLIDECNYKGSFSAAACAEVADFIHRIGLGVGMKYSLDGSSARTDAAVSFIRTNGFPSAEKNGYKSWLAADCVVAGKPVLIVGWDGLEDGHAWVLDGWNEYHYVTGYWTMNVEKEFVQQTEGWVSLAHCNFGWSGDCDGYYRPDSFDTTEGPYSTEPGIGDGGENIYNFTEGLQIIRY